MISKTCQRGWISMNFVSWCFFHVLLLVFCFFIGFQEKFFFLLQAGMPTNLLGPSDQHFEPSTKEKLQLFVFLRILYREESTRETDTFQVVIFAWWRVGFELTKHLRDPKNLSPFLRRELWLVIYYKERDIFLQLFIG